MDDNQRQVTTTRPSNIMAEFFRGWKRKIGVVTLTMACVLMVAWVRSQYGIDSTLVPVGTSSTLQLISQGGKLTIRECTCRYPMRAIRGDVDHVDLIGSLAIGKVGFTVPVEEPPRTELGLPLNWWITESWGIQHGCLDQRYISIENRLLTLIAVWRIPYSIIVLPLTLISALLLLPRKSRQPTSSAIQNCRDE